MNAIFRAVSGGACLYDVKFRGRVNDNNKPRSHQDDRTAPLGFPRPDGAGRSNSKRDERTTTMLYMTLTLMAALISVMFVATAVSSIVNLVRENDATRNALLRSGAFQY
jgi:hypothetical protein